MSMLCKFVYGILQFPTSTSFCSHHCRYRNSPTYEKDTFWTPFR